MYIWDPQAAVAGERREQLVQTIDFGPTLLDWFGFQPTPDMKGRSLVPVIAKSESVCEAGISGIHGGHVCVTDSRYVYMRACVDSSNTPLDEFTLMPTRIDHRFDVKDLRHAELEKEDGKVAGGSDA